MRFDFHPSTRRLALMRPILAFGLPFAVYLKTLAPTVYNLDSAELTTAAATLGITRATGYPLYTLIGHVWAQIPIGDVGFRMNLFSAFCAALTLFLADRVLARWEIRPIPVIFGLGLLASAPYFWYLSSIAEVYTLHTALMAAILLALVRWDADPTPARLAATAFLTGLGITHHASALLLLPGIVIFVLPKLKQTGIRFSQGFAILISGLIPLCLYLYLPIRSLMNPVFNYAGWYDAAAVFHSVQLNTWSGFWWLVSGQGFRQLMFQYHWLDQARQFGADLIRAFFLVGIGPGLLGLVVLPVKNLRRAALLFAWFACTLLFYLGYQVADRSTMFLPCYLVWAMWTALGVDHLMTWSQQGLSPNDRKISLLQAGLVICTSCAFIWNWTYVDQSHEWEARTSAEQILSSLPANAMLLGYWDTIPVIEYLQKVEGMRDDVTAINQFLIPSEYFMPLLKNAGKIRPVYLTERPLSLPPDYHLVAHGDLFQLMPANRK